MPSETIELDYIEDIELSTKVDENGLKIADDYEENGLRYSGIIEDDNVTMPDLRSLARVGTFEISKNDLVELNKIARTDEAALHLKFEKINKTIQSINGILLNLTRQVEELHRQVGLQS